jgi:hypothetical protein
LREALRRIDLDGEPDRALAFGLGSLGREPGRPPVVLPRVTGENDEEVDVRLVVRTLSSRTRAVEPDRSHIRAELLVEELDESLHDSQLVRAERRIGKRRHTPDCTRVRGRLRAPKVAVRDTVRVDVQKRELWFENGPAAEPAAA